MKTNFLSNDWEDDWEDVNMTDADSIWDYCVNSLDHQLPSDTLRSKTNYWCINWYYYVITYGNESMLNYKSGSTIL